jgi:hypothetical protein
MTGVPLDELHAAIPRSVPALAVATMRRRSRGGVGDDFR